MQRILLLILMMCCWISNAQANVSSPKIVVSTPDRPLYEIVTNQGNITLVLFQDLAPQTVHHFIQSVQAGDYNNTLVHQAYPKFIVSMGLYDKNFQRNASTPPLKYEQTPLLHKRGMLSMQRYQHPDTATCEFFVNLANNTALDIPNGYTSFGEVLEGIELLDKISLRPTCTGGPLLHNMPCEPIVIENINFIAEKTLHPMQRSPFIGNEIL